jgi:hypothetical protein
VSAPAIERLNAAARRYGERRASPRLLATRAVADMLEV